MGQKGNLNEAFNLLSTLMILILPLVLLMKKGKKLSQHRVHINQKAFTNLHSEAPRPPRQDGAGTAELPGKVISFYIVPLPACRQALNLAWYRAGRDPAYPALAGRGTFRPMKSGGNGISWFTSRAGYFAYSFNF